MTDEPAGGGRRRDSARSRELLIRAAGELFADRGFDRTTTREIGERAGVDPALIARYFGGKTQLYLAAAKVEQGEAPPADLLVEERLRWLLDWLTRRGPGPSFQSAVLPGDSTAAQEAAREHLRERLVEPLRARFAAEGVDRADLRAEVAAAAFAGVVLSRWAGAFPALAAAELDDLVPLLLDVLGAVRGTRQADD
ncbi:TetR/AcrR family transcriptional regulator [Streptomyces tateyamensis]|uniref:TetR/AcrR family transcriptional regulator n=1 Tax=Streptomyces tateyamensis TaxID=565073 RepID=A0A2V4PR26_9ACTN|nr:TetR/AcrR family transcriptional regulator [Streptomyces tateyamensis]PYC87417.1 TetR/AcrR family transcriptional regulator [Streptomyces tateyamensis]